MKKIILAVALAAAAPSFAAMPEPKECRDGNDEFYAAGSFGPSRWGDDDWSLVEYRVEKESPPEVKE